MRSIGWVEGPFNRMVGVELSYNIGVEVSVEFFFGCGEICTVVRNNFGWFSSACEESSLGIDECVGWLVLAHLKMYGSCC